MAEVKKAPIKKTVSVAVIGMAMTGKSAIMQKIISALSGSGIELQVEWGIDGKPKDLDPDSESKKLQSISKKTKVVLTEFQTRKPSQATAGKVSSDDTSVQLLYYEGEGHVVQVSVLGAPLRHYTGDLPLSRERARIIAARLAASLNVEVEDLVPREN